MPNQVTENETQVNSTDAFHQINGHVTSFADGGYVIAWASANEDISSFDILAQRYDVENNPVGEEMLVATDTGLDNYQLSIASQKSTDGFIITWPKKNGAGNDIVYKIYTSDGGEVTSGIANSSAGNDKDFPDVVTFKNGNFLITWGALNQESGVNPSYGVWGRLFDGDGAPINPDELHINQTTAGGQINPSATILDNGSYAVVWQAYGQDGDDYGIYMRRFHAEGSSSDEMLVNQVTVGRQNRPEIITLNDGSYVVVWGSDDNQNGDFNLFARIYDGVTHNATPAFEIVGGAGEQSSPSITPLQDGGFMVLWRSKSLNESGSENFEVHAQRFDNLGEQVGDVFTVHSFSEERQTTFLGEAVTTLTDGGVIATWHSRNNDSYEIMAREVDIPNSDTLTGLGENDTLHGFGGQDTLDGLAGNDSLFGGTGDDLLYGGDGNDWLDAGEGSDTVLGGAGNDTLDTGYSSGDVFDGGEGSDTAYFWRHRGGDLDIDLAAGTAISSGGDLFTLTSVESAYGSDLGNDTLSGTNAANFLRGIGGNDVIDGHGGNDTLEGDAGTDVLSGGDGYDRLYGGADSDTLSGGEAFDRLYGGSGDDQLNGDDGGDWLYGQDGNDTLNGGTGNDLLKGEAGADVFKFDAGFGVDNVMDFNTSEDSIDLSSLNVSYADLTITQEGGNTLIEVVDHEGNSILLTGVTATDLTESMFSFT